MAYNHYFQAITNRSGDSLVGYFARVIDPATGNTVPLYADANGTPIVVTSGVANMAKTDENGNLSFYNDPGTYNLDIYQPDSTSFILRVPNVAMQSGQGPQGDPGPTGPQGEGLEQVMAPGGASLVGVRLRTDAPTRDQGDKNEDFVDVWDYMTPAMKASVKAGNLQVDTAPAFQAALDFASGKTQNGSGFGRKVRFRGGTYRWDTPVTFNWRVSQGVVDAGDMRRPCLSGDGTANTVIFYTGPANMPALTISGYSSGANGGVEMFVTFSGFWLRRAFASIRTGTGISVTQVSHIVFDDVALDQFDRNLNMQDTLRFHAYDCRFTGANETLFSRVGTFSHPNVIKFNRCDFGGNVKRVAVFTTPANLVFEDCGVEGNGDGTDHMITINGGPQEGGCGVEFRGGYIENNWGLSDIYLNWSASNNTGTAKITGVSFNKTENTRPLTNHILINAASPSVGSLFVHVDACGFKSFGSYTPRASRPVIAQTANSNLAVLRVSSCLFANAVERPDTNGWPAIGLGYDQLVCRALVANNGTATLPGNRQVNVASVTRTGTGVVEVSLKRAAANADFILKCGLQAGMTGFAYIESATANVITVVTTNAAGVAVDANFWLEAHGVPGL